MDSQPRALLCSHPDCQQAHDNWPGPGLTGELCTDHWEAYCERQWWQACTAIDEAGLMIWPTPAPD